MLLVFLSRVTGLMKRPAMRSRNHVKDHAHTHAHTYTLTTDGHVRIEVVQLPTFICCVSKKLNEFCSISFLVSLYKNTTTHYIRSLSAIDLLIL